MNKIETVTVTLPAEIPKNVHKLLKNFTAFTGVSLEELLLDRLDQELRGYWQNGIFDAKLKNAIEDAGCTEYFQLPGEEK